MAITWVAESAASAVAGGDPVVTKPVGLAVDDLMLAIGVTTAAQTITPPGTWSTHPQSLSTARPLYYKIADAADVAAANFTFVTSGAATCNVVISVYRGINVSNPFAGTAGVVSTASTTVTIAQATPSVAATLAHLVIKLNLNTWTPPGTVSPERWDHTISTTGSTAGGHELVAAGATGTRTWTASTGAAAGLGYIVPLREATTVHQKSITAVMDGTPTMSKITSRHHTLSRVMDGTPVLARRVTAHRAMLAVMNGTSTLDTMAQRRRELTAVMDGTGSVAPRSTRSRIMAAVMDGTGSIVRKIAKRMLAVLNGTTSLNRQITAHRTLPAVMDGTVNLTPRMQANRTLSVVMNGTGAISRKVAKQMIAAMNGNNVLIRKVTAFRAIAATMDGNPTIRRSTTKTLRSVLNGTPVISRAFVLARSMSAVMNGIPGISRSMQVARTLVARMNGIGRGFVKFPWDSIPTGGAVTYIRSLFISDD